ncbi:hypothetical protein B0J14DRAFT_694986, partial [Halenospora varia]
MNDVYKRATKLWIWLKPVPSEELNAAEEAVGYISRISEASFNSKQLERATFTTSQLRLPPASSAAWNIIIDILKAPWFTRLWIIQEFTLANSAAFLFGDHVISSDNLQATNNVLHKPRHLLDDEGHNLAPKLYNSGFSSAHFHFLFQYTGKDGSKPIKLDEFLHLKALLDEAVSIVQQFGLVFGGTRKYQSVYTTLTRLRIILELFESDSGKLSRLAIENHRCRRPFVTANNRLGFLFGNEVALGDPVCLFHGLPVHHIIKKREDKSNFVTYRLVGK